MGYTPEQFSPVKTLAELEDVLYSELTRIKEALDGVDAVIMPKLHVEPDKKVDGLLVYADGTNWNPGSGAGFYRWNETVWVFLG